VCFRVCSILFSIAFVHLFALPGWAAAAPPEVYVIERDGYQDVRVQTGLADYLFSTRGGGLRSVYLSFQPYGLPSVELIPDVETDPETFERALPGNTPYPFELSLDDGDALPVYEYEGSERTDAYVALAFSRAEGALEIRKRYVIYNDPYYRVEFDLELRNTGSEAVALSDGYELTLTAGLAAQNEPMTAFLIDGQRHESIPAQFAHFGGAGFLGSGLALFLKNENEGAGIQPWVSLDSRGRRLVGASAPALTLSAGEQVAHDYLLYAGRWKYVLMAKSELETVAGMGPFSQFLVPMIQFLDWLYETTGNYGWAIIIFTLLTRVLLFPLIRQQFHAMAKMREFQPKMNKLRERYPGLNQLRKDHPDMDMADLQAKAKENKEKLNKKMMQLYQKEGINPLGGCLPSLLQFPILIVLWRAILYSAETIHFSPGFLWINDLSLADPYYLLVVLTVGVMMLQTKMTPTMGAGGQNQMIMWVMPIMMGVFLKDFPAGLWLYYFLTTALQVLQQALINWELANKQPAKAASGGEAPPADGAS